MANFAYVVDNKIDSVYDIVPTNWNNISNFCILNDDELKTFGWYRLVKIVPTYDASTQKIDNPTQYFQDGVAYETQDVIDLPIEPVLELPSQEELNIKQWNIIRNQRDQLINDCDWRYTRYSRQTRLGLTPIDDLSKLDAYIQALADIPEKQTDPFNITWPVYGE